MNKKVGLALSAGGPKGYAHIGVLRALDKAQIPIDYIAGCSAGSIAGAFYALTKDIQKIEDYTIKQHWREYASMFFDPDLYQGLIKGNKVYSFISDFLGDATFEDLLIPLNIVTVDIRTGKEIVISKGLLREAVRASISIPGLFRPVENEHNLFVDGALSSPLPVRITRKMGSDIVVSVNLLEDMVDDIDKKKIHVSSLSYKSVMLLLRNLAREQEDEADIKIHPHVGKIGWKSFMDSSDLVDAVNDGETCMEEHMEELKRKIKPRTVFEILNTLTHLSSHKS
ncbi:MAG: patatin-like phospholipase family protein [Candidatus Roizmanbacteria bacterium]